MGLGNNDFEFFFNEGSSFLLTCFIPPAVAQTQGALYSLLPSFILEFLAFTKVITRDKEINQECNHHCRSDGFALRL